MKLALGTVQFGMPYGVSNHQGQTPLPEVSRILQKAQAAGIALLDTAPFYGTIEADLGRISAPSSFKIVTKTPRFMTLSITAAQVARIRPSLNQSLQALGTTRVYGLLVHIGEDLLTPGGEAIVAALKQLQTEGLVEKLGVSVYTRAQTEHILQTFTPDILQFPINVFDQQWIDGGFLNQLKSRHIELHARSIFLQGLLLMETSTLNPYFAGLRTHHQAYRNQLRQWNLTPLEAALQFVVQEKAIDRILVGVNSEDQLAEILQAYHHCSEKTVDMSMFRVDDESWIHPVRWKLTRTI